MIGILLIGNELLSGQVEEKNLTYMLNTFAISGHHVNEVRWVGDDMTHLTTAFRDLSQANDFVFSSGGVGPTHDDITIEAVSAAFNQQLVVNDHLKKSLLEYYEIKINDAAMKMSKVPECAELIDQDGANWPILKVKNCFILPGVPQIFQQKFDRALAYLPKQSAFYIARFYLNADEVFFAEKLDEYQIKFSDIIIGSYPIFGNPDYRTEITIKSKDQTILDVCFGQLENYFREESMLIDSVRSELLG